MSDELRECHRLSDGEERRSYWKIKFWWHLKCKPPKCVSYFSNSAESQQLWKAPAIFENGISFPSTAEANQNFTLAPGKDSGGARPRTQFSPEQSSPLLELAVVLSVINEGDTVPLGEVSMIFAAWHFRDSYWRAGMIPTKVSIKWITTRQINVSNICTASWDQQGRQVSTVLSLCQPLLGRNTTRNFKTFTIAHLILPKLKKNFFLVLDS